jgi:hypothetical protein
MICSKVKYKSRSSAQKALRTIQKYHGPLERSYFCRQCKRWHITSQKMDPIRRQQRIDQEARV